MTTLVDTLSVYKRLVDSAGFDESTAGVISELFKENNEALIEYHDRSVATKKDITDVRQEIRDSKVEIIKWVAGMLVAQITIFLAFMRL